MSFGRRRSRTTAFPRKLATIPSGHGIFQKYQRLNQRASIKSSQREFFMSFSPRPLLVVSRAVHLPRSVSNPCTGACVAWLHSHAHAGRTKFHCPVVRVHRFHDPRYNGASTVWWLKSAWGSHQMSMHVSDGKRVWARRQPDERHTSSSGSNFIFFF